MLPAVLALMICAFHPPISLGQDAPAAGLEPTSSLLSNVRLSLIDGVIERANETKRATVAPEWELLPLHPLLQRDVDHAGPKAVFIEFPPLPNDNFAQELPKWLAKLPQATPEEIKQGAIGGARFNLKEWHDAFREYWNDINTEDLDVGQISPREYYGLRRDHQVLYNLLQSGGFEITLTADDPRATIEQKPGSPAYWHIRQYRFLRAEGGPAGPPRFVYRYTITAVLGEYEVSAQSSVKLSIRAQWRPPKPGDQLSEALTMLGVTSPFLNFANVQVAVEPVQSQQLQAVEAAGGPSRLETNLQLITGVDVARLFSSNLLGGTRSASFISGALFSFADSTDELSTMVGVNRELVGNTQAQLGLVFGITPDDLQTLYIGPSLRFSIVTLSAGLKIAQRDRPLPDLGTELARDFGATLSVDLSRLAGGKRDTAPLQIDRSTVGGDLGLSSDELSQNLAGLLVSLSGDPGTRVQASRKSDGTLVSLQPRDETYWQFVPAGEYKWVVPDGFKLCSALGDASGNEPNWSRNRWFILAGQTALRLVKGADCSGG